MLTLSPPFVESPTIEVFMDYIFNLHSIPTSIVLEQDPTFTSKLFLVMFKLQGTYHPQMDGQMETINKFLDSY